jgi:hypothetical protein
LEEQAELLTRARPLALVPQPRGLSVAALAAQTPQRALPQKVAVFFPVSVFPLLFAPIWISQLF